MRRREFITLFGGAAVWPVAALAQQPEKVPRIGFLMFASADDAAYARLLDSFRRGLRELGYVEGRNVKFQYRYAGASHARLTELATELVRMEVDVIVSHGTPGTLAAKRATATIPIVFATAGDPVGSGLVASLARPGGNVTGMSLMITDLGGKRLELLRELAPGLARAAVLWNALNPFNALLVRQAQDAATKLGIELQSIAVRGADDLDRALPAPPGSNALGACWWRRMVSPLPSARRSWPSPPGSECRRSTGSRSLWTRAGSCPTAPTSRTSTGARPPTLTRY